jgi:hypothetical protein
MLSINLDSVKQEFRRLVNEEFATKEILEFLLRLHEEATLDPENMGWVLWNICDWYAMARDSVTQYKYQSEFFELVKSSFPERAHWVVCDGTQALTLINGGMLDFWCDCYEFANDNVPRSAKNRTVRFEAHRANTVAYVRFTEFARAESSLQAMADLLEEDPHWQNREFTNATYLKLLVSLHSATGQSDRVHAAAEKLVKMLDGWLERVGDPPPVAAEEKSLFGSWQYANEDRPPSAVFVSVHNAACEFAKAGLFADAERLFRIQQSRGRTLSEYGEALFLLSCWRSTQDKAEVIRLLDHSKLSPDQLKRVAPEIVELVKDERPLFG